MRPVRCERGLSLIETLAALGIAGLVGVLLLGAFAFSGGAWTKASAIGDATSEIYATQTMLRRLARNYSNATGGARFAGEADALAFTTRFAMPGSAPVPMEAGLALDTCGKTTCLVLMLERGNAAHAGRAADAILRTPLIRNIAGLDIAYLGAGGWMANWRAADGAPKLVRVDVRFTERDPRRWPPLYLAPGGA